ncbi:hypothetical protein [Weissella confusa]|uniref:hypothetical protein n=1 Tax=Weissella confusa TaxID=1583 RepID=UPI001F5BF600|nr:hypothetical protein [Weissella confusa]
MVMENYFKDLRAKIGHDEIIMPGVAGILFDETRTKVLLEKRGDGEIGWGDAKSWRVSDDLFAT